MSRSWSRSSASWRSWTWVSIWSAAAWPPRRVWARRIARHLADFDRDPPDGLQGWSAVPREIVYVAAPLTIGTETIQQALDLLEELLPGRRLIDGTTFFADHADWRRMWPWMVRSIDRIVVVPAEDGSVGTGVRREITDGRAHGVLVEALAGAKLVPLPQFDLVPIEPRTSARAYRVVVKSTV